MSGWVAVNGAWLPSEEATVSVFDRGFLFADAVYEVAAVLDGRLVDFDAHFARLQRSLGELNIPAPFTRDECLALKRELVARNAINEGIAYLQVSRGAAPRDFAYPKNPKPTSVAFAQQKSIVASPLAQQGIAVVSRPDIRWRRCDIKTVGLLGASMTKQSAIDAGADDAWFVDAAGVTEGTSSNAYVVTKAGALITRQLGNEILAGITRDSVLAVARDHGLSIEERTFSLAEALAASEAFITSATTFVQPVVSIDGEPIGEGQPGPVARDLRDKYIEVARATAL
ncbi:MAG: D-amino-acid transaminase [Pseudomonadota bacterium]